MASNLRWEGDVVSGRNWDNRKGPGVIRNCCRVILCKHSTSGGKKGSNDVCQVSEFHGGQRFDLAQHAPYDLLYRLTGIVLSRWRWLAAHGAMHLVGFL